MSNYVKLQIYSVNPNLSCNLHDSDMEISQKQRKTHIYSFGLTKSLSLCCFSSTSLIISVILCSLASISCCWTSLCLNTLSMCCEGDMSNMSTADTDRVQTVFWGIWALLPRYLFKRCRIISKIEIFSTQEKNDDILWHPSAVLCETMQHTIVFVFPA